MYRSYRIVCFESEMALKALVFNAHSNSCYLEEAVEISSEGAWRPEKMLDPLTL